MLQIGTFLVMLLVEIVNSQERFATDCYTPNKDLGLCLELQNCAKLYDNIVNDKKETFAFIRASACGPANQDPSRPKVCCGQHDHYIVNEESSCKTPNGETARCVSLNSCSILSNVVYNTDPDPTQAEFLRASVCGKDGRIPLVCCGTHTRYISPLPDRSGCGVQFPYKVLGGENTDLGEFPWLALLQHTKYQYGDKSFGCGGSLISPRYVLTAAHCVVSNSHKVTLVRLGEWDLESDEDCIADGICSLPPQDIEIEDIIAHEEYSRVKDGVFNDIALIRLARPAVLNDFVQPICLPLPNERANFGERLYVSGWGATETRRNSVKKQKLDLPIADFNTCKAKFGGSGKTITTKMLCAGGEKGKDSCKGDSGGPLIGQARNASDQYYIEGIVSYGNICGTENWPGVYTRVSEYVDWIRKTVKP